MKCEIADVASFKSLFNTIDDVFDEMVFNYDQEGIRFGGLDKPHILFMFVNLDQDYFVDYECAEPGTFALQVSEIKKILKNVKDNLSIEYKDNKIILSSNNKKFSLFEHEVDYSSTPTLPEVPYIFNVNIPINFIKDSLKDIALFSDSIKINTTQNDFIVSCAGTMGDYSNKYICDKELEESSSVYRNKYIKIMTGADKVADVMTIKGANDTPLTIELENMGITVKYMLAPVIEATEP